MKRIAVLTSGGDAPGMNAAIRAAVRTAIYNDMEIYGIYDGYQGLLEGNLKKMDVSSVGDIIHRGGTILGTKRCKDFMTAEGVQRALEILKENGIEGLVVIGGDGTFQGGLSLEKLGFPVVGVPATIDNDLAYTDFTIGFDTALNTILEAVGKIRDTSAAHGRTIIIEVMGRNCSDLALFAGVGAGATYILLPDWDTDIDDVCQQMLKGQKRGKLYNIIIKAEGYKMNSNDLAAELEKRTGIETRVVVLGYVQRGGAPSGMDRMLASGAASYAVELLREDIHSKAIGLRDYRIIDTDLEEALSKKKKILKPLKELILRLSI